MDEIAVLLWKAHLPSWAIGLIHSHILKNIAPEILLFLSYIVSLFIEASPYNTRTQEDLHI